VTPTPLCTVAAFLRYDKDLRVDAEIPSPNGHIPLHLAAKNGHVEVANLLIRHGTDVNASDLFGFGCRSRVFGTAHTRERPHAFLLPRAVNYAMFSILSFRGVRSLSKKETLNSRGRRLVFQIS